jgi:glycosyltransferase involved in cell wall biosynthesis
MRRLLIISGDKYPEKSAGAVRQHMFSLMAKTLNYEPFVIGLGDSTNFEVNEFQEVPYISFRYATTSLLNRAKGILHYKSNLINFLKSNKKFDTILVVGVQLDVFFFVKKYAVEHNIKLLYDMVEWYSKEEFKFGRFAIPYIVNNGLNTKWVDQNFTVISISSYLNNHFNNRNIKSVRVPFILDVVNARYNKNTLEEKLVLMYAGSIGRKDYIKEVINGLLLLEQQQLHGIEFRLFGINQDQALAAGLITNQQLKYLADNIKFYGRVSREVVLRNLKEADFTVLLRPEDQRYAKAGFPTKVTESLTSGTPVICNLTSDLGYYLKDGQNSMIVETCSAEAFKDTVLRVLNLKYEEKVEMQKNARKTAEMHLDYRHYVSLIKELME